MIFTPLGHHVAVIQVKAQNRMVAGGLLHAPDVAKDSGLVGRVIGLGPDALQLLTDHEGRPLEAGSLVFFSRYSGTSVTILEREVILLKPEEILGKLTPEPGDEAAGD